MPGSRGRVFSRMRLSDSLAGIKMCFSNTAGSTFNVVDLFKWASINEIVTEPAVTRPAGVGCQRHKRDYALLRRPVTSGVNTVLKTGKFSRFVNQYNIKLL